MSSRALYDAALAVRAATRAAGALFVVNDRPDVAAAVDADGVHLGQDDVPVGVARVVLGPDRFVGVSTHDLDEARAAVDAGADYLGVGPVYDTTGKVGACRAGLTSSAPCALTDRPLVAISGIDDDGPASPRRRRDSIAMIALARATDPAAVRRRGALGLVGFPTPPGIKSAASITGSRSACMAEERQLDLPMGPFRCLAMMI